MSYVFSTIEADRLASLALQAAIQSGRRARGAKSEIEPLQDFAKAISLFAGIEKDAERGVYNLDPSSSEMLSHAIRAATQKSITNMDSLNDELMSIVSDFRSNTNSAVKWNDLKRFCLEVHRLIVMSRRDAGLHERGVFDYDHSYAG